MNQEDKELLIRDLCMRLPYGVKVQVTRVPTGLSKDETLTFNRMYSLDESDKYITVKPYLRPMSSMTKEEKNYYEDRWFEGYHCLHGDDMVSEPEIPSYIDWLLQNHFDFQGLIPKGLAIEVKEGIYEY